MTLEEQLFALLEQHGLSTLSLHASSGDGQPYVYAVAHSQGKCAFSKGIRLQSASDAFGSAIGVLEAELRPPVVEVPALAPMGEAA